MGMVSHSSPRLYLADRPLPGRWGDLHIRHRWPYGCWEMTWKMLLKPYERPAGVVAEALMEARLGSGPVWAGQIAELDWDTGAMTAVGAVRQGETTLCLVGGVTSSIANAVVDEGIARGALDWVRRTDVGATPLTAGDRTGDLNYLTALMDARTNADGGGGWGVNARREVFTAPDPVEPTLYVRPGAGVLNVTEEQLAATVIGRYRLIGGPLTNVQVGSGSPEVGVGLLDLGPMTEAQAVAVVTGIRNQLQARTTWTNSITVTADMITTAGGQRAGLDRVVAGTMVRLLGLRDERGGAASTDIVLGETDWDVTARTVEIKPVGLSDRSLPGIVEGAGGVLL